MRRAIFSFLAASLVSTLETSADRPTGAVEEFLAVDKGNIVLSRPEGTNLLLTKSGRDSDPIFSPDRKRVAFVRATPERKIETGSGNDASELWLINADGSNPVRILAPHAAEKMQNVVALISQPHFSCDGRRLYFETTAFATSGAIHVVDLETGKEHFVCAGNNPSVVREGDYRDCLVVQQHRYFVGGGSFDWFWLLHTDGKEIGPIGEETENFEATYPTQ